MIWALHLKPADLAGVHDGAHLTLVLLSNYMSPEGTGAWPSVETLADRRGVAGRTIRRHLEQLEEAGLITRGDQTAARNVPANRRPIVWDLGWSRGDTGVTSRGDGRVTPEPFWGDTRGTPGVTPGVTQSVINPYVERDLLSYQRASHDELVDQPDRDCIHGHAIRYYDDRKTKRRQPMCALCRRVGAVTPAPTEHTEIDPDSPDPITWALAAARAARTTEEEPTNDAA